MRHLAKHKLRSLLPVIQDDWIACVVCGKKFRCVCQHARIKHGLSKDEYKRLAGLPLSVGVIGPTMRKKAAEHCVSSDRIKNLRWLDRSAIPKGGNPDRYQSKYCKDFTARAMKHREKAHEDFTQKIISIQKDFSKDWMSGIPYKILCEKYQLSNMQIKTLRNVLSLPSRVFNNWPSNFVFIEKTDIMTIREAQKHRTMVPNANDQTAGEPDTKE